MRRCRVVLFDEPTADLDPGERVAFWTQVGALQAAGDGPEVALVTTHLFDEVAGHCARVAVLAAGRVRFAGTAAARAAGRCFLAPPGAPVPAGSVVVGVEPDGTRHVLGAGPGQPQPPSPLDGYLAVMTE